MLSTASLAATLAGLAFGLSLIVVIGAQNAFVLRVGLQRRHVAAVVAVCAVSDVLLIAGGVAGVGAALSGRPGVLRIVRIAGAVALFVLGALAARRALRTPSVTGDSAGPGLSLASAAGTALAFTWLNPGVYLDTLVLLGSVANSRPGHAWSFGFGAALGSILWFTALGYGARFLTPLFHRPAAWRALDGLVAFVLVATGIRVLL